MAFLLAAISLGFLGSFHCIGMCGPIALALPIHKAGPLKKFMLVLCYNFGRMVTYSVFGLLAGLIGKSFAVAGYQQFLSVTIGLLILLVLIFSTRFNGLRIFQSTLFSFFSRIKYQLGKLFLKNGHGPIFLIGLLNGLMPCGLVYMGIAGAMTTGNILHGVLFMAVFGLGTIPVMLSLPLAGGFISVTTRNKIRRTVPIIVGVMAVLLILRGLNLGIPYVSPQLKTPGNSAVCHISEKHIIKCLPTK